MMVKEYNSTSGTLPRIDASILEEAINGKSIVRWHSQKLELRLNPSQKIELERAKERGYLIFTGGDSLRRVWFYWCENEQRPYIHIKNGPKYATITIDLIAQKWKLDDDAVRTIFDWGKGNLSRIPGNCKRGASVSGGQTMVTFYGVANHLAEDVARVLLAEAIRCKEERITG